MTAIYIPPPPPGRSTASASFFGELEITTPDNAGIMQKAVFIRRAALITTAWVSGVDGLDGNATGQTTLRLANRPYDQPAGATGITLTLAGGQSQASVSGEIEITAGGWLYLFITQAGGGHYGAQAGFEITWQE